MVPKLDAADCMRAVTASVIKATVDMLAMLQYLILQERVPHDVSSVLACIAEVPAVVDWLRRSACRRGATMALSMGFAHYPEDFDVAEVTSGFPSKSGEVSQEEVLRLLSQVSPYADRVLAIADLGTHQASAIAPEDAEGGAPAHQDFPADKLFAAAHAKELTTYPVPSWTPKFQFSEKGVVSHDDEASGSQ